MFTIEDIRSIFITWSPSVVNNSALLSTADRRWELGTGGHRKHQTAVSGHCAIWHHLLDTWHKQCSCSATRCQHHLSQWLLRQWKMCTGWVSASMPACLSACPPICMPACLPVCLSACLSVCIPVCLPFSFCVTACLPVVQVLSVFLSVYICLLWLPVCVCRHCMFICLSDCLSAGLPA